MATNNLTPTDDLLVREFYTKILGNADLFTGRDVGRKQALRLCLDLLNYTIVDGKFIARDRQISYPFGRRPEVECEWEEDTRRAQDEANQGNSTGEADSSEPTESAEVREAVLSEDV